MSRPPRVVDTPPAPECHPPLTPSPHGGWNLFFSFAPADKPFAWDRLFGRRAPVEMEIGIGSGVFTSHYAAAHPDVNYLGVDNVASEVMRTNDKCRRRGLLNVRLLRADALYLLEDFVPEGSLRRLHIYYSDPWPKKRHHKRRLWRPAITPLIERALEPGGELVLKTDVTEYFEVIQAVLDPSTLLRLVEDRRLDLEPLEGDVVTNFQNKAVLAGHPLHYQRWRRAD
jgi:tRNA (guanine-N7-)-methyltransferase